jgi:hypothetical protein
MAVVESMLMAAKMVPEAMVYSVSQMMKYIGVSVVIGPERRAGTMR